MTKLTPAEANSVLLSLLSSYEFLETLDAVAHTTVYRHSLKEKVNSVRKELEKFTDPLADLMGVDDLALFNLLENKKQLMKKLSVLRPENVSGLNQVLDVFFEAPELTIHRLGIRIVQNEKEING